MSDLETKVAKAKQNEVFYIGLVGIGGEKLTLQEIVDFTQIVMPGVPLSKVEVTLSPDDLGIRIKRHKDDLRKYCGMQYF